MSKDICKDCDGRIDYVITLIDHNNKLTDTILGEIHYIGYPKSAFHDFREHIKQFGILLDDDVSSN